MLLNKWVVLLAAAGLTSSLAFACSSKDDPAATGDDDDDDDTGDDDDDDDDTADDDDTSDKAPPKEAGPKAEAGPVAPACSSTDEFSMDLLFPELAWVNVGPKETNQCTPQNIATIKAISDSKDAGAGNTWLTVKQGYTGTCATCALTQPGATTNKAIMPEFTPNGGKATGFPNAAGAAVALGYADNAGGKALHELNFCISLTCGDCDGAGAESFGGCADYQAETPGAPCYTYWQAANAAIAKDFRAFSLVFLSNQANSYAGVSDLMCGANKPTDIDAGPDGG